MLAEELPALLKKLLTSVDNAINQVSTNINSTNNNGMNDFEDSVDVGNGGCGLTTVTSSSSQLSDSKTTSRGHTIKRRQVLKKKDAIKLNRMEENGAADDDNASIDEPDSPLDAASMPLSCFGDSIPHIDSDEDSSDEVRKNDSCKLSLQTQSIVVN